MTTIGRDPPPHSSEGSAPDGGESAFAAPYGMFARQKIQAMVRRGLIGAARAISNFAAKNSGI